DGMEARCKDFFPLDLPNYSELYCHYDRERSALWYYLNQARPCSTQVLLDELVDFQKRVKTYLHSSPQASETLHYLVCASANPRIFSLGGDLQLFARLAEARDRDTLYNYARRCVDVVYENWTNFQIPTLTTISLVQGTALGGGFEGALSSNVLIAEEGAQLGFPEILFNLFPGMGAYSLLVRRIEPWQAERMLRNARQYPSRELWEMGVVDVVAPVGEGVHAVNDFIRRRRFTRLGHQAIHRVRQRVSPLTHEELVDVVEIWVETAMKLSARDLRAMTRIAEAQPEMQAVREETNRYQIPATVRSLMPAAVS
ncbi:MAG: enoyl-CoA hydratase/isomerase family protein, partial [Pseudomonadota bacterium]